MNNYINQATLDFFGPVDIWGIDLVTFAKELDKVRGENLEVLINSPGGDVFEGVAIAEVLQRREGKTTTTAIGLAASIATVVLMAGDTVQMAKGAMLMIHDAWTFEAGDSETMKKTAETLDKMSDVIAGIYVDQIEKAEKLVGGDREKTKKMIREMMKSEKWLTANEALNLGLIDKIAEVEKEGSFTFEARQKTDNSIRAKFQNSIENYKNVPTQILSKYQNNMNEKKTIWAALKSFFTTEIKAEAKAIEAAEIAETEAQQDEKMTIEQMKEALAKEGFNIEKVEAKAEKVEDVKEQPETVEAEKVDPMTEMQAKFEAMQKEQETLKAELKAAKFKAAAKPSDAQGEGKEGAKKHRVSEKVKQGFSALAELVKSR